jgi:chromatin remodeling complex protein RSC6
LSDRSRWRAVRWSARSGNTIRKNNLQNPANKREIVADEALKKIFGKDKATMFEMNKFFSQHLS